MQTASPEHCAIATRVSTAVGRASSLSMSRAQRSGYIAGLSNCVPVGESSAYAAMVAHPVEDPNIIVKVCTGYDGFILYALLCLNGMLRGPEYLVVHSAAQVGDSWVFVTERLQEFKLRVHPATDADFATAQRLKDLLRATKVEAEYAASVAWDLHLGNIMLRGDQPVILDPWAETYGHRIVGGVPVKVRTAPEYPASKRSVQLVHAYVRPGRGINGPAAFAQMYGGRKMGADKEFLAQCNKEWDEYHNNLAERAELEVYPLSALSAAAGLRRVTRQPAWIQDTIGARRRTKPHHNNPVFWKGVAHAKRP